MLAGKFALLAAVIGGGAMACSTYDAKNDIPPNTIRQIGSRTWFPDSINVDVGTTVRWDVYSGFHGLWFTAEPDTVLKSFNGGESFDRQFPYAGSYEFICTYPGHSYQSWPELFWAGMQGIVVVR